MKPTCALLAILALTCVDAASAADKTFEKHFIAPAGGQLNVDLDSGSVSVIGTESHEVVVHAEIQGSADLLSRITISADQSASGVHVTEHGDSDRGFGGFSWFGGSSARVHFTIDVPRDYPVRVATAGGALELQNLRASVEGTTAGGNITVRDVVGRTRVHTSGGSITGEHLDGPAQLITSGGSIRAMGVRGELDAHTLGGGIWLDNIDGDIDAHTSGGGIDAAVLGDHNVSLVTSGGGIRLSVPSTIRASLDASTTGGSVRSDIPLSSTEQMDHSQLRGAINGGGHTIRLHTSGGSILLVPSA